MKIRQKMLVAPLVAILFLLALGGVSVALMARQGIAMSELIQNRGGGLEVISRGYLDVGQVHAGAYRTLTQLGQLSSDEVAGFAAQQGKRLDAYLAMVTEFAGRAGLYADERSAAQALAQKLGRYRQELGTAMAHAATSREAAIEAMQATEKTYVDLMATYANLLDIERRLAAESSAQGAQDFRNMVVALLGIAVLAAAVALAIALYTSGSVVRPLEVAMRAAGDIARGDLASRIEVHGSDETAELLRAQSRMQEDLRQVVGEVVAGARAVSDTSAQIAQGNLDLSQRTEMQASTLEETASSMEELTSTVRQNAENARQASQLSVGASDIARKGGEVVGEVVSTMTGISESSRKISDIIGVIDGIAFQTNILALNAAVEAARAGEQGRGFAVVATEVRNLAQRSAAAAKEIKGLIGESVDKVEAGTRLVDAAGRTMEEIVASVKKVSDLIAEIAAASEEQSSGIAQVSTAITQMDQAVQQNASLVEEASAATESMKEQAALLLRTVSRFQLGDARSSAPPAPPDQAANPAPRVPASMPVVAVRRAQRPILPAQAEPAGQWRAF